MKEKIKKTLKNKILFLILVSFIGGITIVYAITYFPSNQVTYDNKTSGLNATEVQTAIDELYSKAKNCSSKSKFYSMTAFMVNRTMGVIYSDSTGIYMIGSMGNIKLLNMTANTMDILVLSTYGVLIFSNNDGIYISTITDGASNPQKISNMIANDIAVINSAAYFSTNDGIYMWDGNSYNDPVKIY